MPHLGGIEKAHRRRRVVQRGQKIGFDVIDFCGGLLQAVQNVLDVHLRELPKPLLDDLDGNLLFPETDFTGSAAQNLCDQLHQGVHVLMGIPLAYGGIPNLILCLSASGS